MPSAGTYAHFHVKIDAIPFNDRVSSSRRELRFIAFIDYSYRSRDNAAACAMQGDVTFCSSGKEKRTEGKSRMYMHTHRRKKPRNRKAMSLVKLFHLRALPNPANVCVQNARTCLRAARAICIYERRTLFLSAGGISLNS